MSSALEKITELSRENTNFLADLFNVLTEENYLIADFSLSRLVNELATALNYDVQPVEYIEGEHIRTATGDRIYNEFHPDSEWLTDWVLSAFYTER